MNPKPPRQGGSGIAEIVQRAPIAERHVQHEDRRAVEASERFEVRLGQCLHDMLGNPGAGGHHDRTRPDAVQAAVAQIGHGDASRLVDRPFVPDVDRHRRKAESDRCARLVELVEPDRAVVDLGEAPFPRRSRTGPAS